MVTSLEDQLEPYWEDLDGFVQEQIRSAVRPAHFKYFDACRFKLKALRYINSRVEDLDLKYGRLVDSLLNQETSDRYSHIRDVMSRRGPLSIERMCHLAQVRRFFRPRARSPKLLVPA